MVRRTFASDASRASQLQLERLSRPSKQKNHYCLTSLLAEELVCTQRPMISCRCRRSSRIAHGGRELAFRFARILPRITRWARPYPLFLALGLLMSTLAPLGQATLHAQLHLPQINKPKSGATTSRKARKEAIQAIPFDRLNDEVIARIQSVVSRPSVYRRLPPHVMRCDHKMYFFLVRNPEVVVGIWDAMGATQIDLTRAGPFSYNATDGAGTTSTQKKQHRQLQKLQPDSKGHELQTIQLP